MAAFSSVVTEVTSVAELADIQSGKLVLFFWAAWHEPSQPGGQMDSVIAQLAADAASVSLRFAKVEAEAVPELSERFAVSVVPTFVMMRDGDVADKFEGADVPSLVERVQAFRDRAASAPHAPTEAPAAEASAEDALNARLAKLISTAPAMLFMKGTPSEPRCKFSRTIVEMLREASISFASFDILSDEDVRQGLKAYSEWPTYPQFYVHGSLIGGVDILAEMKADGDLKEQLGLSDASSAKDSEAAEPIESRLAKLINRAPVMLFMKGSPDEPRCGFSRTATQLLNDEGIQFDSFDILSDDDVRQGLKTFSNWPTYPQLYVNGELQGGLDIMQELQQSGSLKEELGLS